MKIDVQVVSYKSVHPLTHEAVFKMVEHTRCKCFVDGVELTRDIAAALRKGTPRSRQSIVQTLADKGLATALHEPHECPRGKHDVMISPRGSSSVVHWSRNALMMNRRKDADYVLLCDDDMLPPVDAIDRMLAHKQHIVSGLCTKRQDPPEPTWRVWDEHTQNYTCLLKWDESRKLVEVDAVGTGFLMLSREVIEHVAYEYHRQHYETIGNGFWFEFMRNVHGGEFGEDIAFCWKAKRLGYRVWVDTTVCPGHFGDYHYGIEDYMQHQADVIAAGGLTAYRKAQVEAGEMVVGGVFGRKPKGPPLIEPKAAEPQAPEPAEMNLDIKFEDGLVLKEG